MIRTQDQGEWVLIIDSDEAEPERAWETDSIVLEELRLDSWEVAEDPAPIRHDMETHMKVPQGRPFNS